MNGLQLGWLIDPFQKNVYIYRLGEPMECLQASNTVSGDPTLPGFVLQLTEVLAVAPAAETCRRSCW